MTTTTTPPPQVRGSTPSAITYQTKLTRMSKNPDLVRKAQRLRFQVFNDIGEGLASSKVTGLDEDKFDGSYDHLLITAHGDGLENEVIATYRLQTGRNAAENNGYYMGEEFGMEHLEKFRPEIIELGRAAIHKDHRKGPVLMKLFGGIANYAFKHSCRYLIGCSSIVGKDKTAEAAAIYRANMHRLAPHEFRVTPHTHGACPLDPFTDPAPKPPALLDLYMTMGARFCGEPFVDSGFNSIDFPTYMDLVEAVVSRAKRFFREVDVEEC